jgi:5'-nucleotidase
MNRRYFLTQSSLAAGTLLLPGWAQAQEAEAEHLVILHTNDVHSRLDPFPMDGSRHQGMGGVAARAALIEQIRKENKQVLLLDAGDIFQGTPYFNLYKGEPEMKAMQAMGYDACTMGNHDFDAGLDNFATQLQHVKFPVLVSNYDFSNTPMEGKALPYKIFRRGRLKIGVLGVGIELKGLVPDALFGNTVYLDPVAKANETAYYLKYREKCDLVICLSHLGYSYREDNKISDKSLAAASENIDLIIGGHTHVFLTEPERVRNKKGEEVLINQVGWGGIVLGRLDYIFTKVPRKNFWKSHSIAINKKTVL